MTEERLKAVNSASENQTDYQAPAIEEVVNREGLEREVAYAGVQGPSNLVN